jgi:hypothetical protein
VTRGAIKDAMAAPDSNPDELLSGVFKAVS